MKRNNKSSKQFLEGTIKRHPDGFGFFIPDQLDHADVYVPRHSMKQVMTNDKVMLQVFPEQGGERFRGEIIKVISRGTKSVVGVFHKINESAAVLRDEGKGWGTDLKIPIQDSLNANEGQLVSVQITSYPGEKDGFRGVVKEVIGDAADPLTDVKRVLLSQNIPHEFSAATLKEAASFEEDVSPEDTKGRKDIRKLNFITIDGATAKDFDDAIFVDQNDRGFLLYVAIADVSHYVKPGMAIDKDAYERGTSVYFPNFVVPMLPEVLSNGLCSLNPHKDRLALVAEIQMDFTGETIGTDFYEAVFESKARVTYGEAQEIIDGNEMEKHAHVKNEILRASDLAKVLMAKRFREGSLDLEIPDAEIILDSEGIPTDMIRSERLFAHRLIEEMMLSANVAVAKFFHEKEIPAIYRIHEPPHQDAIETLERYLHNFGSTTKIEGGKLQKRLTKALQEFEGKPESQILNILALRSMSQAKYSPNNVGHFGLGFEFYTHFTSPIRRYPDLIVHRLLKYLVASQKGYRALGEEELQTSAVMLSAAEQRSVKAERQFESIKKARFMAKFLGQEFEGIISSVTKFGVFVLLRNFEVDGLIRLESLGRGLEFDEENLVLRNPRTGVSFSIGDPMKVLVAGADPDAGQVDFQLVKDEAAAGLDGEDAWDEESEDSEADPRLKKRQAGKLRQQDFPKKEKFARESGGGRRNNGRPQTKFGTRSNEHSGPKFQKPAPRDSAAETDSGPKTYKETRLGFGKNKEQKANKPHGKSKKAQHLDRSDIKVHKFLNVPPEAPPGEKGNFDPAEHFETAMKKWKARNSSGGGGGGQKPHFGEPLKKSDEPRSDSSNQRSKKYDNDRPRGEKSEKPARSERPSKPGSKLFKKKFKNRKSR